MNTIGPYYIIEPDTQEGKVVKRIDAFRKDPGYPRLLVSISAFIDGWESGRITKDPPTGK
jgi:hypothetical protein